MGKPADIGRHDRRPAGLSLERDQAEGLAVRRHQDEVGGAVPLGQDRTRDRRDEPGLVGDAEIGRERLELARTGQTGAAGTAEHGQHQPVEVGPPVGVAAEQLGADPQQHVWALQRLDAADEEKDAGATGQAQSAPSRGAVTGGEGREVHAGCHDAYLGRVGVVELDEVSGLALGVGHEPVRRLDDLRLADLTAGRFWTVVRGEVEVLDPGHGVHRVDEGDAPAICRQPADLAGQPVVRVQDVVPALGPGGRRPHHAGGEGAQLAGQVRLAQSPRTARR
jgi:hypothetical protein